ncbi:MAG: glycosyltransferase family 4 protein [Candidatus Altiarchaeales archaeon]|nr:glycosyltransferase family 4 protein [Candidatus Altiarchaeales archaeon]
MINILLEIYDNLFNLLKSILQSFIFILTNAGNFDLIYVRDPIAGTIALIPKKIFRKKMIHEINGIPDERKLHGNYFLNNGYVFILELAEKISIKNSDRIIGVTQRLKEYIIKKYGVAENEISVVPNGVNTAIFHPMNDPRVIQEIKGKLKISKEERIVGFVGTLAPWQGLEYLIEAAPLILKEIPEVRFILVGDGPMKDDLEGKIRGLDLEANFIFTGTVPYREVPGYINASDVCVVPKKPLKSGYSPLKLYEYMACGKPVIASRISGFEILEQNNAGILVEPENPRDLAKAIIKLLEDDMLGDEMGRNGREYVVETHSWESVARKVEKVCKKVFLCERK